MLLIAQIQQLQIVTMKIFALVSLTLTLPLSINNAMAANLTYLTCKVASSDGRPDRVFDFTLDEANSTVSFYVKEANAMNVKKAVFGPETITWSSNSEYTSVTRTINRVDLSFSEETDIAGIKKSHKGACIVKTPKSRKI